MSRTVCTTFEHFASITTTQYCYLECWPTLPFQPNVRCSAHGTSFVRLWYIKLLTSIGSSDGENSQQTLLIMLKLVTESLPELSRCTAINADVSNTLRTTVMSLRVHPKLLSTLPCHQRPHIWRPGPPCDGRTQSASDLLPKDPRYNLYKTIATSISEQVPFKLRQGVIESGFYLIAGTLILPVFSNSGRRAFLRSRAYMQSSTKIECSYR